MTTEELFNLTAETIVKRIRSNDGLSKFIIERAKFEGWLKVEIIDILCKRKYDARPEVGRIDVSFDSVGIELKTLNTNKRYEGAINKSRPITKNVKGVIEDIECLRNKLFTDKFVVFIVFPIEHENKKWVAQRVKIEMNLTELLNKEFKFKNGLPAVIYYGRLKDEPLLIR